MFGAQPPVSRNDDDELERVAPVAVSSVASPLVPPERPTERRMPVVSPVPTAGFRLLVVSGSRAQTFTLPASGEITIGRSPECEIFIDDLRLSRRHATLAVGDEFTLQDLGSANGCQVGASQVAPRGSVRVAPGMVMMLGRSTLVIQRGHVSTRLRHVRSHEYFEARVEDECARAEATGGAFSVVRLRCKPAAVAQLEESFTRWLRSMDIVALYAPHEYELLLVDTAREGAEKICEQIASDFPVERPEMAIKSYPAEARTPETLSPRIQEVARETPPLPQSISAMDRLKPILDVVASGTISVLILGETGVGKEVAANTIHRRSPRAKGPLVSVSCAGFSESLLDSELFGHEKGAFTGAHRTKVGLLESADGGTFFLDEVGEMPHSLQAKLLRVLEQRQVLRIGAVRPRTIDVRLIAATNRDLENEVARGNFRRDLYYRLAATTVVIPPLRERRGEILGLARLFVEHYAARARRKPPRMGPDAHDALLNYTWPGNVRELKNVIERAVLLCGEWITAEHLPIDKMGRTLPAAGNGTTTNRPPPSPFDRANSGQSFDRPIATMSEPFERTTPLPPQPTSNGILGGNTTFSSVSMGEPRIPAPVPTPRPSRPSAAPHIPATSYGAPPSFSPGSMHAPPLDRNESEPEEEERITDVDLERLRVIDALERCAGNQTQAARLLGVSRRTFIKRLEAFALPRPRKPM